MRRARKRGSAYKNDFLGRLIQLAENDDIGPKRAAVAFPYILPLFN